MSCATTCVKCDAQLEDLGPLKTKYFCDKCSVELLESAGKRALHRKRKRELGDCPYDSHHEECTCRGEGGDR